MKKKTTLLYTCAIAACLLLPPACIKPPDNTDPRDGDNVYNGCRVKQTASYVFGGSSIITRRFAYNSYNDPVSINSNAIIIEAPGFIFFKYDAREKLIEYSGQFDVNGPHSFVHRYGYSQGRIVTDTLFANGYGSPENFVFKAYVYLRYDNLNRIVQDSAVYIPTSVNPHTDVTKYIYNQDGNLTGKNFNGHFYGISTAYDNKLNPSRTNKIWMLIDRNYSVNNPVAAVTYNSSWLPLTYAASAVAGPDGIIFTFGDFSYSGPAQMVYDCK